MRGRPQITVDEIFQLLDHWRQTFPKGVTGREERLERIAAYILAHLDHVRSLQRLPSKRDLDELSKAVDLSARLGDMIEMSDRTGEKSHRKLARLLLGKSAGDMSPEVLRLAREYGALINGGSGLDD